MGHYFPSWPPKFLACYGNIARGSSSKIGEWQSRPFIVDYCCSSRGREGGDHILEMLENISLPLLFSQPPEHRGLSSLIQLSLDQPHGSRETGGWHVPWGEHISEANPFQDLLLYHACHPCYPSSWRKSPASVFLTLTSRASQKPSTGPSGYMT